MIILPHKVPLGTRIAYEVWRSNCVLLCFFNDMSCIISQRGLHSFSSLLETDEQHLSSPLRAISPNHFASVSKRKAMNRLIFQLFIDVGVKPIRFDFRLDLHRK